MKAVIMAGGLGSRLRPITNTMPKPMVPIVNTPILEHIIRNAKNYGVNEFAITLNYMPQSIIDYFGDGERLGVDICYYTELSPLGTAGSVRAAIDFLDEDFFVISGDSLSDIDLDDLMKFHKKSGGKVTMAGKRVEDARSFGVIVADENGKISDFVEKPIYAAENSLVNTGIYAMKKDALRLIPEGFYDFSKDLFPIIKNEIYVWEGQFYWSDIGTLENYYLANRDVVLHPERFGIVL